MEKPHIFIWPLVILGILFVVSFFFSLSETALMTLNKIRLRHLVNKGSKNAKIVHHLISHLDTLIATILVGNNIVNIGISAIGTVIIIYFVGERWGLIVSTLVISFSILVFAEITPKIFAARRPDRVSLFVAQPISLSITLLRPVVNVLMTISNFLIKIFGQAQRPRSPFITQEEMKLMIEVAREEGAVSDEEKRMLHRIFEFGNTQVADVMVPKEKIVAVEANDTPEKLLDMVVEEGHSRIPVYKDSIENIIGIIYTRDILQIWHNKGLVIIQDLIQPAYFIPQEKKVNDLLRDFQRMKIQIAIVVDEAKKAQGLVTLEDLTEEIVGKVEEHR